jgi:hypothetical protein
MRSPVSRRGTRRMQCDQRPGIRRERVDFRPKLENRFSAFPTSPFLDLKIVEAVLAATSYKSGSIIRTDQSGLTRRG